MNDNQYCNDATKQMVGVLLKDHVGMAYIRAALSRQSLDFLDKAQAIKDYAYHNMSFLEHGRLLSDVNWLQLALLMQAELLGSAGTEKSEEKAIFALH